MHSSRKVFLLPDGEEPRCVVGIYEPDRPGFTAKRTEYKTFDKLLKVDDYIVVPSDTRWNMTTCKIVAVDVEPALDTEDEINWVMGSIDQSSYLATIKQEENFITAVRVAEKKALKKELRKTLFDNLDTSGMMTIEHKPDNETE